MITPDFTKNEDALVPAIAQDWQTGEILMLANINKQSWEATLESGTAVYWSRSRQKLWKKGETSGNVQKIKEILVDCDMDAVIFKVDQVGEAACHTGRRTCFYRRVTESGDLETTCEPLFDPKDVYKK